MKKILTLLAAIALTCMAHATIRTVSNSVAIPAQYTTLDAAITAASAGDTLYVMGTPNTYFVSNSLTKPLTILGTGFNPQKESPAVTTIAGTGSTAWTIKSGSSGSHFIGVNFIDGVSFSDNIGGSINHLDFEYCLGSINLSNGTVVGTDTNIVIKSCGNYTTAFKLSLSNSNATINNVIITNSIITVDNTLSTASSTNVIYDHNIISNNTGYSTNYNFLNYSIVQNNIFIDQNYGPGYSIVGNNLIFNNNIFNGSTTFPNFSGSGASGTNNIGVSNISFTATGNYHLLSGSTGAGYANDATDVGIYGGTTSNYYWSGEPQWFPVVKQFDVTNPTVPQNGTLNVVLQSRKARDGQQ